MKLIVQPATKNYDDYLASSSGFLFGLKNFSSGLSCTLSLEEIERIKTKYPTQEIFVAINKMIYDEELDQLKAALIKLDQLKITGVFFYDLAVLALKQELGLQVDLVWNNTHMVTNANTCNYYVKQGVKYGLLSSEITLDEMVEINNKTTMQCMVLLVGYPIVALSKRRLLSNFYHFLGKEKKSTLRIQEPITHQEYELKEDQDGTSFYFHQLLNGSKATLTLLKNDFAYGILNEEDLPHELFLSILKSFKEVKNLDRQQEEAWLKKIADQLGSDYTGFFYQKTIYKVKKNEEN